jgi:hypothetical protein
MREEMRNHPEKSLREKVAATSQEATQIIATLLSSRPGSAKDAAYVSGENNPDVFCGLNRKFEGAARKPPRGIVNRKQRSGAGISVCWVCGKDHMARDNHPAVEVREALAKQRSNNAYLSADSIGELYIEEE